MTDRHSGYIVTLAEDIREDDAEAVIAALKMIKGVIAVTPVVHDHAMLIAEQRLADQWRGMLWRLYRQARDHGPESVLPEVGE